MAFSVENLIFKTPIKAKEIRKVIKSLKNGKQPGFDGINYELVKMTKDLGLKYLLALFKVWWDTKHVPNLAKHSNITLHFKGNGKDQNLIEQLH